jgi:putative solute:sodium symporter small subunit
MNVRRLAAIDMHGLYGTTRRRRIVLTEFVLGVLVMAAAGIATVLTSSSVGGLVLGWWMIGAGLNYAPLAVHAITLIRPGALDRELSGIDPGSELRRYGLLQLWIFIPLSLVVWDLARRTGSPREP